MVQINFALKEVNCKIVYYGPGMSGKTTNLEVVHRKAPEANKGELTSIATEGDRTLFFDFMPLDLGNIAGMRTKFQLYTVPGQVYYNSTRKLVLQGVDGVIFVADSQEGKMDENLESMENLRINLAEYGKKIDLIPMVIQYNKRDLPNLIPSEELEKALNPRGVPSFDGVATTGEGVFPTLKALSAMVLESLSRDKRPTGASPTRKTAKAAAPAAPAVAEQPAAAPAPQVAQPEAAPQPKQRPDRAAAEVRTAPPAEQEAKKPDLPPVGGTIKPSSVGPAVSQSTRVRTGASAYSIKPPKPAATPAAEDSSVADMEQTPELIDLGGADADVPVEPEAPSGSATGPTPKAKAKAKPKQQPSAPAKQEAKARKPAPRQKLARKYVIDEEKGSPVLLIALVFIILAAVGVILYSFNIL